MYKTYLKHHGILNQKWGKRNGPPYPLDREDHSDEEKKTLSKSLSGKRHEDMYDRKTNSGDRVIKKGSNIYRISTTKEDPVYDRKKYVSLTKSDHEKWQKYIGDEYANRGQHTYNIMYSAQKDLRIASYTKIGEIFTDSYLKNEHSQIIIDTVNASKSLNYKSDDLDDMLSLNFAMQTQSGKKFVDELIKQGYDGVEDRHGRNTADDPVIIFNPEENFKKKKITTYK